MDKEIIKSLEGAVLNAKRCDSKVWSIEISKLEYVLELTIRQQEEIEALVAGQETLQKYIAKAKAEAVKEFAERLKAIASQGFWEADGYVGAEQIDDLIKEMVGDDNA